MKKLLFMFLLFSLAVVNAQNFVPNPSFEDTVHCPSGSNIADATGWTNAGYSPDYYNACANTSFPLCGVPNSSYAGYQYAYDGNAYAGFVTCAGTTTISQREYIEIQLLQQLTIGTKYYVSGYISRADSFPCSANKFGFKFSSIQYSTLTPELPDNFAHVHSDLIISDRFSWTRIAGSFVADSAYPNLIIGNFYDNTHTDTSNCSNFLAYYFVDAICVSTDSLYCLTAMNIKEENRTNFSIYPNPANDIINIDCSSINKDYEITMYDMFGRKVLVKQKIPRQTKIDVSTIPNGIYLMAIDNKYFNKIIINH